MRTPSVAVALLIVMAFAWPAAAQRVSFERTLDTPVAVTLDVSTLGGRIELRTGAPGRSWFEEPRRFASRSTCP